jgi:hypothetical protein
MVVRTPAVGSDQTVNSFRAGLQRRRNGTEDSVRRYVARSSMGRPSGKTKKEIEHEASRLNWNITPSSPGRTKMGTGYFFMTGGRSIGGSSGAAARLGVKWTTLQSKMRKLGISRQS